MELLRDLPRDLEAIVIAYKEPPPLLLWTMGYPDYCVYLYHNNLRIIRDLDSRYDYEYYGSRVVVHEHLIFLPLFRNDLLSVNCLNVITGEKNGYTTLHITDSFYKLCADKNRLVVITSNETGSSIYTYTNNTWVFIGSLQYYLISSQPCVVSNNVVYLVMNTVYNDVNSEGKWCLLKYDLITQEFSLLPDPGIPTVMTVLNSELYVLTLLPRDRKYEIQKLHWNEFQTLTTYSIHDGNEVNTMRGFDDTLYLWHTHSNTVHAYSCITDKWSEEQYRYHDDNINTFLFDISPFYG